MSSIATTELREFSPRSSNLRTALWVWVFALVSQMAFRQREVSELMAPGGFDMQVKFQIAAWMGLGVFAWQLIVRRVADLRLVVRSPLCWFAAYVVIAMVSTLYSTSPPLTLYRAGQLAVIIALVISLRDSLDRIHLFVFVFLALNWVLVLMANLGLDFGLGWIRGADNAFMVFDRQTTAPWRFSSPMAHASQISIVGGASAVGLAMRTTRKTLPDNLPFILFAVVTVLLTVSRTAIAAMLVGFIVVAIVRKSFIPLALLAGFALPLALIFTPVGDKLVEYTMRGQSVEEFQSLTGRSDIYRLGIARAMESMPLGEGFCAGRAESIVEKNVGQSIVHAHNLFIESAIGMGLLGLFASLMILVALGRSLLMAIQLKPDRSGVSPGWEPLAMSIPLVAFCILDRGFAAPAGPYVYLFVVVLAMTTRMLMKQPSPNTPAPLTD